MNRRTLLLPLAGAAAVAAQGQTITACAPVLYKMPRPCNSQCPACGEWHGPLNMDQAIERRMHIQSSGEYTFKVLQDCAHCRAAFFQDIEAE